MSKGPFTARINQIDTAENFHILQVEQLTEQFFHGQKETLKVPVDERLSSLRSGDVITYYRAEEEYVITKRRIRKNVSYSCLSAVLTDLDCRKSAVCG